MSMTYTWEITSLKTQNQTNADGDALANAGTDSDGNTGSFSGATPFTAANTPADTFVAFADLTEATVLGWIKAVVVGGYEEHVNGQIQSQIDEQTVQEPDMPWS
jgi:hypothetical protein